MNEVIKVFKTPQDDIVSALEFILKKSKRG